MNGGFWTRLFGWIFGKEEKEKGQEEDGEIYCESYLKNKTSFKEVVKYDN